jgi:hypothetical protein
MKVLWYLSTFIKPTLAYSNCSKVIFKYVNVPQGVSPLVINNLRKFFISQEVKKRTLGVGKGLRGKDDEGT